MSIAASRSLAQLALLRGRLHEAEAWYADAHSRERELGLASSALDTVMDVAFIDIWFRGLHSEGVAQLDSGRAAFPTSDIPAADRPYVNLVMQYAVAALPI